MARVDRVTVETPSRGGRERFTVPGRAARRRAAALALCVAGALAGLSASGCRVNEDDIHRWELTAHGPDKLRAVLQHDKYDTPLRVDAAVSLIRMKPRAGRRIGIGIMVETLAGLSPDTRQAIVRDLVPAIIGELKKPPPVGQAGQAAPPDASYAYKDAAFAMLTHDGTVVVADEKLKADLKAVLVEWAMADFENRLENRTQAYGMEQLLRFIGPSAVVGLPKLMTRQATRLDQMAGLVSEIGDEKTKAAGSTALTAIAQYTAADEWLKDKRPKLEERNAASKLQPTPEQFDAQLVTWQGEELLRVLGSMKKVGGRAAADYCLNLAAQKGPDLGPRPPAPEPKADKAAKEKAIGLGMLWDTKKEQSEKRRQAALAALEGRLDRNNADDIKRIIQIASSDAPDIVLDQAFRRIGEMPRELVVDKLYDLFKTDKWKVRRAAGVTVLKMSTVKHVDEFMGKLPEGGAAKGFAMGEAITFGAYLGELKEGKPLEAVRKWFSTGGPTARATALAYFLTYGSKDDMSTVQPFENDGAKVPVCDTDPDCKWSCDVIKEGTKDQKEPKDIRTLGDFVKWCIEPAIRDKAPEGKK